MCDRTDAQTHRRRDAQTHRLSIFRTFTRGAWRHARDLQPLDSSKNNTLWLQEATPFHPIAVRRAPRVSTLRLAIFVSTYEFDRHLSGEEFAGERQPKLAGPRAGAEGGGIMRVLELVEDAVDNIEGRPAEARTWRS